MFALFSAINLWISRIIVTHFYLSTSKVASEYSNKPVNMLIKCICNIYYSGLNAMASLPGYSVSCEERLREDIDSLYVDVDFLPSRSFVSSLFVKVASDP